MTDDPFVAHRSLLFTVAYEMLGSAADAEDVVQETWLRWAGRRRSPSGGARPAGLPGADRHPAGAQPAAHPGRRREEYVGEWLPEPLLTSPDVAEDVELAESVSIAMLTVLETLTPTERAVFVLREVFDDAVRRDRGGRRQDAGRGAPDRPPGPRARRRPAAADAGRPRRAGRGASSGSWPRCEPATCRG